MSWTLGGWTAGFPRAEWEAAGVRSAAEVRRWRRAGVTSPAEVRVWSATVRGGADLVAEWHRLGLDVAAVARWLRVVDGPAEARGWLHIGVVDPQDAERWKRTCDSLDEVVEWRSRDQRPEDVLVWRSTCVSLAEVDVWLSVGARASDAATLSPDLQVAAIEGWKRAGVDRVPEITAWLRAGFDPREAKKWRKEGLAPAQAAACRDLGLSRRQWRAWNAVGSSVSIAASLLAIGLTPADLPRWRGAGFEDDGEVVRWAGSGLSMAQAVGWRDAGFPAMAAARWSAAAVTPPEADRWRSAGLGDPDHALPWIGLRRSHDPRVRRLGDPTEAHAWRAAGFLEIADAARWAATGVSPSVAAHWRELDCDPGELDSWIKTGLVDVADGPPAGLTSDEALAWFAIGVEPSQVPTWKGRWSIALATTWVVNLGVGMAEAWQWYRTDIGLEQARRWVSIGVVDPLVKERWKAAIGDVDVVQPWVQHGFGPEEAVSWQAVDVPVAAAREWAARRFSSPEAEPWIRLGVTAPNVEAWREHGFGNASQAAPWVEVQATPQAASAWSAAGYGPAEFLAWVESGLADADEGPPVPRSSDLVIGEARRWAKLGVAPPLAARLRRRWAIGRAEEWAVALGTSGVGAWIWHLSFRDLAIAEEWRKVCSSPTDARRWSRAVGDAGEAAVWSFLGLGSSAARVMRARWPAETARTWCDRLGQEVGEAARWYEAVDGDLPTVEALTGAGITSSRIGLLWLDRLPLDAVITWATAGFADPDEAHRWRDGGWGPIEAFAWQRHGVEDPAEAAVWQGLDVDPVDVRTWLEVGGPADAEVWIASGESRPECARDWGACGITPARAAKLRRLGFTAAGFRALHATGAVDEQVRERALAFLGLAVFDELPAVQVDGERELEALVIIEDAAELMHRAGEPALAVLHGAPRLTPAAIEAVPGARYVRGEAKAALWRALADPEVFAGSPLQPSSAVLLGDGSVTRLELAPVAVAEDLVDLVGQSAEPR